MSEILFHGSKDILKKPFYGGGKRHNDYGPGFYCTREEDMAREWSVDRDRDGYVNQYELDTEGLDILNLEQDCYSTLHWLGILLENRTFDLASPLEREAKNYILKNFSVPYRQADVIIGYRADDSYFAFAQDFISGTISYRQLSEAMRLGKLGLQVVLKSKRSFNRLNFLSSETVKAAEWYEKKRMRDRIARQKYFAVNKDRWQRGDLYMVQILEEGVKDGDPRLR